MPRPVDDQPRRRFTVAEYYRLAEVGVLRPHDRVELLGGEIVAMSPIGRQHEVVRSELFMYWGRRRQDHLKIASGSSLRLTDDTDLAPDLMVFPADLVTPDVRPNTVLLVVEISDTSLAYDQTTKADLYAANGVAEYWVIDAKHRSIKVHRKPEAEGYGATFKLTGEEEAVPERAPELNVRLAELASG